MDYVNVTAKITKLEAAQLDVAAKLCAARGDLAYAKYYREAKDNQDFLYQISKKQKYWPIRKTVELYGNYVLELFPCWLLSPENVSSILPLVKNLFDLVIFDEASQVFIESTIPTIYRGKNIVVAGDSKQLRPSTAFLKRYLGGDVDTDDVSMQAALEVDSLLDLAVARYESANLTYHYRSRHSELIDFSNSAFYSSALQIAPNVEKNTNSRPIERIKVSGTWVERKNMTEAKRIIELLTEIFNTRKNNESIGIITFNNEQQSCIADLIDREMAKSPEFRCHMIRERHRFDNGEDTSIFIKNLENVQGDERDIIIFSIGYAGNEEGRVYANFGSLSAEGGENRLNVAITRAKSKIYVVTSIEPEELKVEGTKHLGPKLLKKYLTYARAVSDSNLAEIRTVLSELNPEKEETAPRITTQLPIEEQIKERLEKLGYRADVRLGGKNTRISLAVYDKKKDSYALGIELDRDAYTASSSTLERDVYKPIFLESKGWRLMRVWTRDWWLYPQKVIKAITDAVDGAPKEKAKSAAAKQKQV
ncbi:MAG: helicase, partial [Clostridia bacterium]|nr:helicase [Clostridia bacterium]